MHIKKIFFISLIFFLSIKIAISLENIDLAKYQDSIEEHFSTRELDTLEGLWIKSYANQGPTGCVTMFFKVENNLYHQIHIDSCFVMNKVTGKQVKENSNLYNGKNAVYYYDGKISWGKSKIQLEEDFNLLSITHISATNTFTEKWKRVWPKDLEGHNKSVNSKEE